MSLDLLNNKERGNLIGSKVLSEDDIQNGLLGKQNFFNSKKNTFEEISAFKDSPFGQYWEKRLPSFALADYGPARVFDETNFSIIDLPKKFSSALTSFYNNSINENWDDIKFVVYANPDGQEILKQYANPDFKPKENEVMFLIETDDGRFDFGRIVRVKLGIKAVQKLHHQFPLLGQTDAEELAEEFLKRPFELKNDSSLEFVATSKETKLNTGELKNLLAKAIKYEYKQKKFDDLSWFLLFLQGEEYIGLNTPKKILEISQQMRLKKYEEEKFWNALLEKGFTPAFLPNVIAPQNREDIKESIKAKLKKQIENITKSEQNDVIIEKIFKEILNNVLLYLFDKFSSLIDSGLEILDDILPEGEMLNEIYNLNAFLVGLWNGCIEFVAGIVDLISLLMIIARDGIGFALTDALGEAFENLLSEIVYNFEDFLKKLWEKFRIAIKEIPNWYLKYGSNQYFRYKELGELMPDIITLLVPALKAGKASKVAEEASLLKNLSKAEKDLAIEKQTQKYLEGYYETLRKESDDFSKKLEAKTAEGEVKESFDNAENELDELIEIRDKTTPSKNKNPSAKPSGILTKIPKFSDDATRISLELENEAAEILAKNGFDIEQNPNISGTLKNPDYKIEDKIFDCFSPNKPNKSVRNIWSEVEKKIKEEQTKRIILNLKIWEGDIVKLEKQFLDWKIEGLEEVMYITKEGKINHITIKR
jgi:hypothetical protein